MAEKQSSVTLKPSALLQFLEEVRGPNLPFSSQQIISAHQLLLTLLAQGEWPEDPLRFQILLAPILCSSAEQQAFFYAALKSWLRKREEPPTQGDQGDTAQTPTEESEISPVLRQRNLATVIANSNGFTGISLVLLCVYVFVFVALVLLQPKTGNQGASKPAVMLTPTPTPPQNTFTQMGQVTDAQHRPVANVEVAYLHKITYSDTEGRFQLQFTGDQWPFFVLFVHSGYEAWLWTDSAGSADSVAVQLPPMHPLQAPYIPATFYWFQWAATLAAPILCLAWLVYRRLRLNRWSRPLSARLRNVDPAVRTGSVYTYSSIRRLAAKLRRPRPCPSDDLDAVKTVYATAKQGGYFTPILSVSKRVPEYLVLIERIYEKDQFGRLYRDLVEQLVEQHVRVKCFEFQADPRTCRAIGGSRRTVSFSELAAHYPHHTVAVFCEPRNLHDPMTARSAPWVSALSLWKENAIFSSTEIYGWSPETRGLRGTDTMILPATLEGLERWAEPRQSMAELDQGGQPSYPSLLTDPPDRWLLPTAPNSRDLAQLCVELREFLGSAGYNSLRACAAYPLLFWPLTLFFAWRLVSDNNERLKVVEKLVRLPWFRYGEMPDWLRVRLLSGWTDREASHIRNLLLEYLDEPERIEESSEPIEVVERWSKSARPLQNHIFLSFVWGRKLDRLGLRPPARWRRMLLRFGFWWQPGMICVIALAAVLGVAAWFAAGKTLSKWKENAPPLYPQGPQDSALAHVINVAQSQLTATPDWNGTMPFVSWCFDAASKVYLYSHSVPDATAQDQQWTNAADSLYAFPKAKMQPRQVHAGMIFATRESGMEIVGLIEAVRGSTLFTIEAPGRAIVRNIRRFEDISLGFIDYSHAPVDIRLPDGTVGQSYSAVLDGVPASDLYLSGTPNVPGLAVLLHPWRLEGIPSRPGISQWIMTAQPSSNDSTGAQALTYRLHINIAGNVNPNVVLIGTTAAINPTSYLMNNEPFTDISFDYDSSSIRPEAVLLLKKDESSIRSILANDPATVFVIEGNTDERRSTEYALSLGNRLADSVKAFLVNDGIPAKNLATLSYGKEKPVCTQSTESCWEMNRRVHFSLGRSGIAPVSSTIYLIDNEPFVDIDFNLGSSQIPLEEMARLERDADSIKSVLSRNPQARISVQGGTDSTGRTEVNLTLAEERAETVRNALLKRGIPSDKLQMVSVVAPPFSYSVLGVHFSLSLSGTLSHGFTTAAGGVPTPNSQPSPQHAVEQQTTVPPIASSTATGSIPGSTGQTSPDGSTSRGGTGTLSNRAAPSSNTRLLHSDLQEAKATQRLDEDGKKLGPDHPQVARDLVYLADLWSQNEAYDQAKSLYLQALDIDRKGKDPAVISGDLLDLAEVSKVQGQYSAAESYYQEALAIDRAADVLGRVATDLSNLGALYEIEGKYTQAEEYYRLALGLNGLGSSERATLLNSLARLAGKEKQSSPK